MSPLLFSALAAAPAQLKRRTHNEQPESPAKLDAAVVNP
jgi:hypothetical protein